MEFEKTLIICGDFNFCTKGEENHPIKKMMLDKKFKQMVKGPTHIQGRWLDHVYIFRSESHINKRFNTTIEGCYYSDHDIIVTTVSKSVEEANVDGLASKSQVKDQDSCKSVRWSRRNVEGEGDSLASQSRVQDQGSHKALRRSGRNCN